MVKKQPNHETEKSRRDVNFVHLPSSVLPAIDFDGMVVFGADPKIFPELENPDFSLSDSDDES